MGDMVKLIELLENVVITKRAKDAETLEPKWYAASCPALTSGHTDIMLSAEKQNLSHLISYLCGTW